MPLKRLPDPRERGVYRQYPEVCISPQHNPPSHMDYRPGRYQWTCPACGRSVVFTVQSPVWSSP